jgi:predicted transcriptional regulator
MPKTKLQMWMSAHNYDDDAVARAVRRVSRVQISRIRRGVSHASIETAMRLQELTGIRWHHFVRCAPEARARLRAAR